MCNSAYYLTKYTNLACALKQFFKCTYENSNSQIVYWAGEKIKLVDWQIICSKQLLNKPCKCFGYSHNNRRPLISSLNDMFKFDAYLTLFFT